MTPHLRFSLHWSLVFCSVSINIFHHWCIINVSDRIFFKTFERLFQRFTDHYQRFLNFWEYKLKVRHFQLLGDFLHLKHRFMMSSHLTLRRIFEYILVHRTLSFSLYFVLEKLTDCLKTFRCPKVATWYKFGIRL